MIIFSLIGRVDFLARLFSRGGIGAVILLTVTHPIMMS